VGERDLVAIFTGAHGMANGLDAVLDVAAELERRGRSDIKLLFIGDGKMKPGLQARAKREHLNNCVFMPPVAKVRLAEIMARADVGLMILQNIPAFYYGTSPNKFFDYLALGLPVVTNYPGWVADLIGKHACGCVVPPQDAAAFASALETLAGSASLRVDMGRSARALGEREFDRTTLAGRFADFLEQTARLGAREPS
jgi:glycosyltransferase involved in cell wall biosynthesis